MRRVIFIVQRLVTRDRPTGCLDDINIKAVFLIKAHRLGHDDRRGTGDRHKADIQLGFFGRAQIIKDGGLDLVDWQDRGKGCHHGAATDHFGKRSTRNVVVTKHRTHNCAVDGTIKHFFAAFRRFGIHIAHITMGRHAGQIVFYAMVMVFM